MSLYAHNLLINMGIILLSIVILGVAFVGISYKSIMNESKRTMESNADEVVHLVSAYSTKWDLSSFQVKMLLTSLSSMSGFHMLICDTNGAIISCSDWEVISPYAGQSISGSILETLIKTGTYSGVSNLGGIYPVQRHVVAKEIFSQDGGNVAGYLILSSDTASMSAIWKQSAGIFLLLSAAVLAITLVFTVITTKKQTKPIREMAAAANKFAHGDFSVRVSEDKGPVEFRELADAFNVMADYLERSEKTRRELIGNVSHELKTPMTSITGFADGILDGTIPKEEQDKYIAVISSETKRLSRMVRGMLDLSHLQEKSPVMVLKNSFNLNEVLLSVLVGLEKKINDRGLDVDVQVPEEPICARGDSDAITQVVYNLTDNAIKFSRPGTTLRVAEWKQGDKVFVSVEDTGETIPQEELPLIFDRFHKSDHSRSMDKDGVGLGLYIVKTIINNHNGDIFVTSADGVTTFVFSLKIKEEIQKKS